MDEFANLAHKLMVAVITLGVFCAVSVAYSMFVWFAAPSDAARESRVRTIILAGVTGMSGSILVVGFEQIADVVSLLTTANVKSSAALVAVANIHPLIAPWEWWCIVGVLTAITILPLAVGDDARRLKFNKTVAGLNFALALVSLMLTMALYAGWRGLGTLIAAGG